jgi:hypothetical protein
MGGYGSYGGRIKKAILSVLAFIVSIIKKD